MNAEENTRLFEALKGGSSNFGIVTKFDMQAFEVSDLWGEQGLPKVNKTAAH